MPPLKFQVVALTGRCWDQAIALSPILQVTVHLVIPGPCHCYISPTSPSYPDTDSVGYLHTHTLDTSTEAVADAPGPQDMGAMTVPQVPDLGTQAPILL